MPAARRPQETAATSPAGARAAEYCAARYTSTVAYVLEVSGNPREVSFRRPTSGKLEPSTHPRTEFEAGYATAACATMLLHIKPLIATNVPTSQLLHLGSDSPPRASGRRSTPSQPGTACSSIFGILPSRSELFDTRPAVLGFPESAGVCANRTARAVGPRHRSTRSI